MRESELRHYEKLLLEKRSSTEEGLNGIVQQTFSEPQKFNTGELSSYDQHEAEQGLETFEREKDLGLKEGLEDRLQSVDRALDRIRNGNYGYCLSCGKELSPGRLQAMPDAEYCVDCQEDHETVPWTTRPVEEQVIESMADLAEWSDHPLPREDLMRGTRRLPRGMDTPPTEPPGS